MFKLSKLLMFSVMLLPVLGFARDSGRDRDRDDNRGVSLKDFAGPTIAWGYSVGGIGAVSLATLDTPTLGNSQVNVSQSQTDRRGNGVTNFISFSTYEGVPGSLVFFGTTKGQPTHTFTVSFIDAKRLATRLTVHDFPVVGDTFVFEGVSIKRNGKIQESVYNIVSGSGSIFTTITGPSILFSKRQ